jgi:hypothetical protein
MMGRQRALNNARGEHPYVCARITGTHAPQARANAASLPGGVGCGSVFALLSLPSAQRSVPARRCRLRQRLCPLVSALRSAGAWGRATTRSDSVNKRKPHPLSFRCREGGSLPSRAQPSRPPAGASIFRLRARARQPNTPAERPRQGPSDEVADMHATTQQRRPASEGQMIESIDFSPGPDSHNVCADAPL